MDVTQCVASCAIKIKEVFGHGCDAMGNEKQLKEGFGKRM